MLVVVPTSQGYVAASPQVFFTPRTGAPKRSDGGLSSRFQGISPLNWNKIVPGKIGWHDHEDDLEISDFGLKAGPHLQVNDSHQIFDQDLEGYAPS